MRKSKQSQRSGREKVLHHQAKEVQSSRERREGRRTRKPQPVQHLKLRGRKRGRRKQRLKEEEGKPQIKVTRQQEGKARPQLVPQQKVKIERLDQTNLNLAPPRPIPSARSTKVGTVKSAMGV